MKEQVGRAVFRLEQSKRLAEPTYFTPEEYDITLQALQNELKRLDGCNWCNRKSCLSCQWNHAGECTDSLKCVSSDSVSYEALSYCPRCGRKLKEVIK